MEIYLILMLILMIFGSIFSLHAKDLLSAVISYGIVGFALVIAFLLLQAPDLAIVQIVVEIITLVIMIAVIKDTTHEEEKKSFSFSAIIYFAAVVFFLSVFFVVFNQMTGVLTRFGEHFLRMSSAYLQGAPMTGSANLVTGIVFNFRAYDTLGEATVLFTAVIGVLTVLRVKGKKKEE